MYTYINTYTYLYIYIYIYVLLSQLVMSCTQLMRCPQLKERLQAKEARGLAPVIWDGKPKAHVGQLEHVLVAHVIKEGSLQRHGRRCNGTGGAEVLPPMPPMPQTPNASHAQCRRGRQRRRKRGRQGRRRGRRRRGRRRRGAGRRRQGAGRRRRGRWRSSPAIGDHIWKHFRNRNKKEETNGRSLQRPERQKTRSVATFVLTGVFGRPGNLVNKVNVARPF